MPKKRSRVSGLKVAALVLLAVLAAALLYGHYRAARLVSEKLTAMTGLPVSVGVVDIGLGSGLGLHAVKIGSPPGYGEPLIASIKSIHILPDYPALIKGRLELVGVRVSGPELFVEKDSGGAYNLSSAIRLYNEKNRDKKPPELKYSVGLVELVSGRVELPQSGLSIRINRASLEGLSSLPDSTAAFSLDADDARGARLQASGTASLFGPEPVVDATITASAAGLGGYMKGRPAEAFKNAGIEMSVEAHAGGAAADVAVKGGIRGIEPVYGGQEESVSADFHALLSYDRAASRINIKTAELKLPELIDVGLRGNIKEVSGEWVGDIYAESPDIDLLVLRPYLPDGFNVEGAAAINDVYIEGPLRPFSAEAGGRLAIKSLSGSYNGKGISGASGGATVKYSGGRVSGRCDFRLAGGGITGGFGYAGKGGSFRLTAIKLLPSSVEGFPETIAGTVDAQVEGELGPGLKTIKAGYTLSARGLDYAGKYAAVSVEAKGSAVKDENGLTAKVDASISGLSLPDKGAAISDVIITADVSSSGKRPPAVSGGINAVGIEGWGWDNGELGAEYSYGGGSLALKSLDYRQENIHAWAKRLDAVVSGTAVKVELSGGGAVYGKELVSADGVSATLNVKRGPDGKLQTARLDAGVGEAELASLPVSGAAISASYDDGSGSAHAGCTISGNPVKLDATAQFDASGLKKHDLSGNLEISDLNTIAPAFEKLGVNVGPSGGKLAASFTMQGDGGDRRTGGGRIKLTGLSAGSRERTYLSGLSAELAPVYDSGTLTLPPAGLDFGGYFKLGLSGLAKKTGDGWSGELSAELPRTGLGTVQEGVLEALPERFMWADMSGGVSAKLAASYAKADGLRFDGEVEFDAARLGLPDAGLDIGPVFGRIPIGFKFGGSKAAEAPPVFRGETFDRDAYPALVRSYSKVPDDADIVIDRIKFGFVELEAVTLDLEPGDGYYDINWFGLSTFKGNLYGYGRADLSGGRNALSLIVSEFSLSDMCSRVPAIEGYLSGRVGGLMRIVVSGKGYEGVTGAAMFWANDGPGDEREISREFIKKLMGSSMKKYMSLFVGDRYFDTGELETVFSRGYLVFDKLLIENTNFLGQRDLHITVAPVSNKISIEHLLEVIRDVGERAKGM